MKNKTSVRANALIWFGAGVSIAEILTGTYFSTLGFGRGMAAILLGHLIGGALTLPLMGFYSAVCGVLRGIGTMIGFAVIGTALIWLLQPVARANLPVISDSLVQVVTMVQLRIQ